MLKERTIQADWREVGRVLNSVLNDPTKHEGIINGWSDDNYEGYYKGAHITMARGKPATIRVTAPDDEELYWITVLDRIEAALYSPPAELTAEEIIAKYYMRRGRNKKLTLRQHIKDMGTSLSEGYIRKAKTAYDKRHKTRKLG